MLCDRVQKTSTLLDVLTLFLTLTVVSVMIKLDMNRLAQNERTALRIQSR